MFTHYAWTALLVVGSALAGGCATRPLAPASGFDRAQATRHVYVAALREAAKGSKVTQYVVDPVAAPATDWGLERLPALRADTRADFLSQRRAARMPADLDSGLPVTWFSEADWNALPQGDRFEGRWTHFWERFPGALGKTDFSRIGFSRDGTQALVYVMNGSAGLSAWGDLFLLERHADGWHVVLRENVITA